VYLWNLNIVKLLVNLLFLGNKLPDVEMVWNLVEYLGPNGPDEFHIHSPLAIKMKCTPDGGAGSVNIPEYIPLNGSFNQLLLQVAEDWILGQVPDVSISYGVFNGTVCGGIIRNGTIRDGTVRSGTIRSGVVRSSDSAVNAVVSLHVWGVLRAQ